MTISSGVISVFSGRLPEMKTTEPYSPTPRAKAIVKPVTSAGITAGRTMRRNTVNGPAPSVSAASSRSRCASTRAGCTERTTNGSPIRISATTTPIHVYATCTPNIPCSCTPSQPVGENTVASAIPETAVGNANGRSISASTRRRPGNS